MVDQPELNEQEPQGQPSEADDIAGQMIKMLVGAFVTREGREPTPEEVEDVLGELTEERVLELMGGGEAAPAAADADANADVEKAGGVEVTEKEGADKDEDEADGDSKEVPVNPFGFSAAPAAAASAESSPIKSSSKRQKV